MMMTENGIDGSRWPLGPSQWSVLLMDDVYYGDEKKNGIGVEAQVTPWGCGGRGTSRGVFSC